MRKSGARASTIRPPPLTPLSKIVIGYLALNGELQGDLDQEMLRKTRKIMVAAHLSKVADDKRFTQTAQIGHVSMRGAAGRRRSVAAVCRCQERAGIGTRDAFSD